MNFLPDVYVECPECHGSKYNHDTLDIKFKGKNIAEVLDLTVDEAIQFFENQPKILRQLQTMEDVGLGYIKLGQPATTFSGGEAQRIKLATELARQATGKTMYILDEPTTGMDPAARRVFWTLLDEVRAQGVTFLMTTHQPDEAGTRADQVVVIHRGTVIADATPAALIDRAPVWFTCARHLDTRSLQQVLGPGFEIAEVEPGRYRVHGQVGVSEVSAIRSWVAGHGDGSQEVTVVRTLEEAYLDMTGGAPW